MISKKKIIDSLRKANQKKPKKRRLLRNRLLQDNLNQAKQQKPKKNCINNNAISLYLLCYF
jgi:hypothetical protein